MFGKELMGAVKGRILWFGIKAKYGAEVGRTRYLIFCSENEECNLWGILLLSRYIRQNKYAKVIVIAPNRNIIRKIRSLGNNVMSIVLSKRKIHYLLNYYSMMNMSDLWTAVSVTQPYNTGAERMLGQKGVTYREIIYYDIYKLSGPDTGEYPALSKEERKNLLQRWKFLSGKEKNADIK